MWRDPDGTGVELLMDSGRVTLCVGVVEDDERSELVRFDDADFLQWVDEVVIPQAELAKARLTSSRTEPHA